MIHSWQDIQNSICRKCIDGDGSGMCRLPIDEDCALQVYFPQLQQTIERVNSQNYGDYVTALRQAVCKQCKQQDEHGTCWKRDHLECALDRYYPLIIEIVEQQLAAN